MSEETLSEFIEELSKRNEPAPRDLFEKYERRGLAASEMAAAAMAQSALRGAEVPESAFERSARKVCEMREQADRERELEAQRKPSLRERIARSIRRWLNIEP